jgi:hypothetical protein
MHLEDWRPIVALAGHIVVATVASLGLVGGTVRSSQDADLLISHPQPMSTVALRMMGYRVMTAPQIKDDGRDAQGYRKVKPPQLFGGSTYQWSVKSAPKEPVSNSSTIIITEYLRSRRARAV